MNTPNIADIFEHVEELYETFGDKEQNPYTYTKKNLLQSLDNETTENFTLGTDAQTFL